MLWDILFLVAGLPAEWRVFDKNYGIVEIGADMLKQLQSAPNLEDVSRFVRGKELSVAIFRVDASSEMEAVSEAKEHLEGVLDGLYTVGEKLAKASPYVF